MNRYKGNPSVWFRVAMLVAACAYASAALADYEPAQWQYQKTLGGEGAGYKTFALDEQILDHSQNSLADLRIIDDGGKEAPYVITAEGDASNIVAVPARLYDKGVVPGSHTVFTLDLGQSGVFHNRVNIQTRTENFRRMVTVEGSHDGVSWVVLTSQGQIYDYTVRDIKPVKVQDTAVSYPESTVRYLRLTIRDAGETPIDITGAEVMREVKTVARETSFSPVYTVTEDAAQRTTNVVADLGSRGIPTRRAGLSIVDENFSRRADIYASDDGLSWTPQGTQYMFRIRTERFTGETLTLIYNETQKRYLKFAIANNDDKPLTVQGVDLYGVMRSIVFRAEQGAEYAAAYGNPSATRPQYDIERLFPYVNASEIVRVTLGAEMANPRYTPPVMPLTERSPSMMPIALGVIAVIMAFFLARIFMQKKTS